MARPKAPVPEELKGLVRQLELWSIPYARIAARCRRSRSMVYQVLRGEKKSAPIIQSAWACVRAAETREREGGSK